jgi:endonuclease V-like protein UPF0215 family
LRALARPRLLGIDDGPFQKGVDALPLVALVSRRPAEGVAIRRFPVDGEDVTGFLADWVRELRFHPAAHALVLGGVTIAGLAIVDLPALAAALGLPVIAVSRRDPSDHRVAEALAAAGLAARIPLLERAPEAWAVDARLHASVAGAPRERAQALLLASRGKSALPEALRVAH